MKHLAYYFNMNYVLELRWKSFEHILSWNNAIRYVFILF